MSNVLPFPSTNDRTSDRTSDRNSGRNADRDRRTPEPRLRHLIGDVLRDERREQERTLAEVAESAAVSLPYLSEVERGRKEVSSDVLGSICDALDLPLVDVLERSAKRLRVEARAQRGTGLQLTAA